MFHNSLDLPAIIPDCLICNLIQFTIQGIISKLFIPSLSIELFKPFAEMCQFLGETSLKQPVQFLELSSQIPYLKTNSIILP